ncbi:MAG: arylesterase [Vicinamibacteria bacterium]
MRRAAAVLALAALAACTRDNRWTIVNEFPQGVAVVAFGDSLTAGYQMGPGESYPEQLAARIGRPVLNRGVSGDSTAEGVARLERDVLDENPRIVLLALGANDMLRRQPIDPAFANLRAIVDRIHAKGALVVMLGVDGPRMYGDWDGRYRQLARETGCVFVPDLLDGVIGDHALMYDQVHPNAKGYAKIAERLDAEVGAYLRR